MSKRSDAEKAIERLPRPDRIRLAKAKMTKVLDHFLYVVELHANNSFVVFSPVLASQIPQSYAANAFNVFQRSMHQIEIVRLCAIWDGIDLDKENIPTVVALIDDDEIIEMLAEETRSHWVGGASERPLNPSNDPALAAIEREMVEAIQPTIRGRAGVQGSNRTEASHRGHAHGSRLGAVGVDHEHARQTPCALARNHAPREERTCPADEVR